MLNRSRKLSLFESMLLELLRMVVIILEDEGVLYFKLVSRVAYRATKNPDGSDVVSLDDIGECSQCYTLSSRSALYRKPAYLRHSGVSPHICESCAKWEDQLSVLQCKQCNTEHHVFAMHQISDCMTTGLDIELPSYPSHDCAEVMPDSQPPCE